MTALAFVSLCLVAVMLSTASAKGGVGDCCHKLSETRPIRSNLKCYYKQHEPTCPIDAVVFTTVRNVRICADPNRLWTKTSMAFLDGKYSDGKPNPCPKNH